MIWAEEKDFKRAKLPGKYMVKMLYRWENRKFENKYLRKLERNWRRWKEEDKMGKKDKPTSSSRSRNLKGRIMSDIQSLDIHMFMIKRKGI